MKITILAENTAPEGSGLGAEFGFSSLVEFNGEQILFDTGSSGLFIENAKKLGVDLGKTDFVVLSHGHWDHSGGLPRFIEAFDTKGMTFVSHPDAFEEKVHGSRPYIRCPLSKEDVERAFGKCMFTRTPFEFMPGAIFLGEATRTYEDPGTCGDHVIGGRAVPDSMYDDSAVVFKVDKSAVLLTGCSHSGILNLAKAAEKYGKLRAVVGGFHLHNAGSSRMDKIMSEFKRMGITALRPGHCTGDMPISMMERNLGARRITTGEVITL